MMLTVLLNYFLGLLNTLVSTNRNDNIMVVNGDNNNVTQVNNKLKRLVKKREYETTVIINDDLYYDIYSFRGDYHVFYHEYLVTVFHGSLEECKKHVATHPSYKKWETRVYL